MYALPLSLGLETLIDDEDWDRIKDLTKSWQAESRGLRIYARGVLKGNVRVIVYMHRLILGTPAGIDIDHIDGNGLNNQRANLREVTRSMNNLNAHIIRSDNTSGTKGVYYDSFHRRWKVEVKYKGRKFIQRSFLFKDEAVAFREQIDTQLRLGINPLTGQPL